jgi:acetyl esterase/lipase
MRRTSLVLRLASAAIWFLFLGIVPSARAQEGPQPPPPFEQVYQMPAVYDVPGMDKVYVRRDIVYKTVDAPGGKTDLKLDLYLPADPKKGRVFPAVILISGGGVEGGDHDWRNAGVYKSYGRILAASGFAGIVFNKRYARGPAGTLNGVEDLRDQVGYIRQHAVELSLDKDRLAYWAFSAGGFLLAPVLNEAEPYSRAVICFYCVSDVEQDAWAGVPGVTDENRARARAAASSVEQIRKSSHPFPPIFVGRAGWDGPGLNNTIDKFIAEALAKNAMIEVMNHPTGRHGFDIIDSNDRSREIIRRALEFLKTNLATN